MTVCRLVLRIAICNFAVTGIAVLNRVGRSLFFVVLQLAPQRGLVDAEDDSLTAEGESGPRPVYKKWWVWAVAAVAVGVLVALAGGGSSSTQDENLPDFPDPPER